VTRPEEALERAREAVARKRAEGGYTAAASTAGDPAPPERPAAAQLREWSLIEVDPELVYSTRRGGAPITALKRGLLRLLRQYTAELEAQQTRFNVAVLAQLGELESRLAKLEQRPGRDVPE
jgi:hypothetical protein